MLVNQGFLDHHKLSLGILLVVGDEMATDVVEVGWDMGTVRIG